VSLNSDDPAYFGGNMNANFIAAADALAFFVADAERRPWPDELDFVAAEPESGRMS
jgi:hypothetical protein